MGKNDDKENSGLVKIILSGVTVTVLAIFAVAYFQGQQKQSQETSFAATNTPLPTKTDKFTEDIKAEIKKYEDAAKTKELAAKDLTSRKHKLIDDFFTEQSKGNDASRFFCERSMAKSFFAVRKWEIVDEGDIFYKVRVDSSNKGGSPITLIWSIWISTQKNSPDLCIVDVSEAQ